MGHLGGCAAIVFRGKNDKAHTDELTRVVGELYLERQTRLGVVIAIEASAEPPDNEHRQHYAMALRASEREVCSAVQAVLATGLRGAAYRTIMSAIQLLSRPNIPTAIVDSTVDAAQTVAETTPGLEVTAARLHQWLESLRKM